MGEKRALQRSGGDSRNQDGLGKKPRGEASSNSRLSPDHAVRQYQLYDQQRFQERQSNANSRDSTLMERLYALAQIQSLSKDEFIEKYIHELQIKDQECDDTENALIVCSKNENVNSIMRKNYQKMLKYTQDYRAGSSQPDVASGKRPLSEEEHKYTLIDIAIEALGWQASGRNKPLDPKILKFVESQDINPYNLDQPYNHIRRYYDVDYKMNANQIEDVMLRVYDYYKTAKANIRRKKDRNTEQ
jgi:hypothetical protein